MNNSTFTSSHWLLSFLFNTIGLSRYVYLPGARSLAMG